MAVDNFGGETRRLTRSSDDAIAAKVVVEAPSLLACDPTVHPTATKSVASMLLNICPYLHIAIKDWPGDDAS